MIHNANCPSNGLLECSHPHLNQPASAPVSPAWAHTAPMARGLFGSSGPLKTWDFRGTSWADADEIWPLGLFSGCLQAEPVRQRQDGGVTCVAGCLEAWLLHPTRIIVPSSCREEKGENNGKHINITRGGPVVAPSCTTSCVVRLLALGDAGSPVHHDPFGSLRLLLQLLLPAESHWFTMLNNRPSSSGGFKTPACEWQSATWCLIFAMTQLERSPFLWRNQPSELFALIIFNLCHNATTEVCRFSTRVLEVKPCAFARPTSVAAVEFSYPNLPSPPLHHFQPRGA